MPIGKPLRVLALSMLLASLASAQALSPQNLAHLAHGLVKTFAELRAVDKPDAEQKQALADAETKLAQLVRMATEASDWTIDHYVQASSPLLHDHADAALAISEAGIKHFAESRFLWDHKGLAQMARVANHLPSAERLAGLETAKKSLEKAFGLQPETWHAHAGMMQTLDLLGDVAGALRELDIVMKDEEGRAAITTAWAMRASMLLRSGKPAEAIAALETEAPKDLGAHVRPILLLRAHALKKDAAKVALAVTALLAVEDSPRMQLEVADALFFIGDKAGAAKALAKLPALGKWTSEEERIGQICTQSGAALAVYWKATDITPKGPLRAAMTKALDHKFVFMDPTAKPKPKETDLSSSPLAMTNLLKGAMAADEENLKEWANRALLVLCLQALPAYKPTAIETGMLAQVLKNSPTAADLPAHAIDARWKLGDPDAACSLSGVHAIERLLPAGKPSGN